jgi:tRNA-Thr(GGU) m(6)t(6)A37 methyltransferase TsaA
MIYKSIGKMKTPFSCLTDMPIQPITKDGAKGFIEICNTLVEGLTDLDGFSHVIVLYHFHRQNNVQMVVTPFFDDAPHGVFATRAPCRPNPIGLSVLKLLEVKGNLIAVEGVDMLDNSPVLDVKPYISAFDHPKGKIKTGWLAHSKPSVKCTRSDGRFTKD